MADEHITFEGRTRYGDPPGRCIYCHSSGAPDGLRDEHIIAFSLGMDAYLPDASCECCEKETSYLDGYAGRHIFGPLRLFLRIQSRHGTKLDNVPVIFTTDKGSETRMIPRAELPTFLVLPILEPPGLYHGKQPIESQPGTPWVWYMKGFEEQMKQLAQPGDISSEVKLTWNSYPITRMLAKVAHTFAIARLGIDSFKPFLPEFILGKAPQVGGYLVGGAEGPTEPLPITADMKTGYHQMQLFLMASAGKPTVVAMTIRLFTFTGSPTYSVIVGEAGPSAIAQLMNADGAITP